MQDGTGVEVSHGGLSVVNNFVDFTLLSVDNFRRIMQKQCDDANFTLRPWIIETVVTRKADENYSDCTQISNIEKEAEEINIGIGKALAQAQQLRESIFTNVTKDRRQYFKPTVQQIYGAKAPLNAKVDSKHTKGVKRFSVKSQQSNLRSGEKSKSTNFIAANKLSVRAVSQRNSKLNTDSADMQASSRFKPESPCMTELNSVIKKITAEPCHTNAELQSDSALHSGNETGTITEKKRVSVDVIEALSQFGVPQDMLKSLKIYNAYVSEQCDERKRPKVGIFLDKLNNLHKIQSNHADCSEFANLISGFGKLQRDLHENFDNATAWAQIKKSYGELDCLSKKLNIKKYNTLKIKKPEVNTENDKSTAQGWLSNGIWQDDNYRCFSVFVQSNRIRYTSKNQLLLLFKSVQHLQQLRYQKTLHDLIVTTLLPILRNSDPTSTEYIALYKMIFTIVQTINPRLPVLVYTEN